MSTENSETNVARQLADFDARLRTVEAVQQLILRILSTTKPLDSVLEHYGATESQEQRFYKLLDDLVVRARTHDVANRPTHGYFELQLASIFPERRGDGEFTALLVDTMKLDRPAYRELHAYAIANGWPTG